MRALPSLLLYILPLCVVSTGWIGVDNVAGVKPSIKRDELFLDFNTSSFIKNSEYFGPYVVGHTLAGYQLHPHLKYTTTSGILTKLGVWLQQDWASPKFFSKRFPTFTLQYQSGVTTFLIGTLDGIDKHRLLRPLCDGERLLTQMPETGFRIYHVSETTFVDLWLHWLTVLNKKKEIPEELLAGLSCEQVIFKASGFTMHLPLQLMLYHVGGQGIAVKDYSLWMGAIGDCINFHMSDSSLVKDYSLAGYYVTNLYVKQPHRAVKRGHGFYGEATCRMAWLKLQLSYWHAYGFNSENFGHPLYQTYACISTQAKPQDIYRHLIFLHIIGTYHITNALTLVLHIDPYYDLKHRLLEHEAGLYLSYNLSLKLLELGNNCETSL